MMHHTKAAIGDNSQCQCFTATQQHMQNSMQICALSCTLSARWREHICWACRHICSVHCAACCWCITHRQALFCARSAWVNGDADTHLQYPLCGLSFGSSQCQGGCASMHVVVRPNTQDSGQPYVHACVYVCMSVCTATMYCSCTALSTSTM